MNRLRRLGRHAEQPPEQAAGPEAGTRPDAPGQAPEQVVIGIATDQAPEWADPATPQVPAELPQAPNGPDAEAEPGPEVPLLHSEAAAEEFPVGADASADLAEAPGATELPAEVLLDEAQPAAPPESPAVAEGVAPSAATAFEEDRPAGEPPAADTGAAEGEVAHEEGAPEGAVVPPPATDGTTVPLSPAAAAVAEPEELTALPANAVVGGRYIVQSQLHHSSDRNLYRVGARKQQKCPTCGRLSGADASECEHCGSALQDLPPADFYLMAEGFHPQALMQDPAVMDLNLYHPNIVPVIDFFSYKPFGRTRYYAVAEPRQGVRLSQMSMPRPGAQVFGWALQLADALDYLHSKGVVGAGAEADDILVQGDTASLASLQNARLAESESPERSQLQSLDLAKLAATIYEAYAGHPAAMSPEGILPMPSQAPEKVGAAFRAAIEPMQGIAPPITAAQWREMLAAALLSINELEQPGRPVHYVAATLSDVGRVRDQNQDSFATVELVESSVERPMLLGLYVVADGMGGHKGGEIASAIAAQAFSAEVMARVMAPVAAATGGTPALTNEGILGGMVRAAQSANERIYKARDSRQNDMGTTLVAALLAGGKAYIVNIGDSRFYYYSRRQTDESHNSEAADTTSPLKAKASPKRTAALEEAEAADSRVQRDDYGLTQVSVDHSLVHRLVELGQLDPEEAKVHPHRNFIYRSLGGPPPIEVDTFVRTLHPGDRLLLCSDGLNSMIDDSEIEEVLATEKQPETACEKLVELANEAGGHDNITVLLVDVIDYMPFPEHQ